MIVGRYISTFPVEPYPLLYKKSDIEKNIQSDNKCIFSNGSNIKSIKHLKFKVISGCKTIFQLDSKKSRAKKMSRFLNFIESDGRVSFQLLRGKNKKLGGGWSQIFNWWWKEILSWAEISRKKSGWKCCRSWPSSGLSTWSSSMEALAVEVQGQATLNLSWIRWQIHAVSFFSPNNISQLTAINWK